MVIPHFSDKTVELPYNHLINYLYIITYYKIFTRYKIFTHYKIFTYYKIMLANKQSYRIVRGTTAL